MNIRVKKLNEHAQVPKFVRGAEDAAADLYATEDVTIPAGEGRAIGTGLAFEIPQGTAGVVWDRSGLAFKHGLTTFSGLIDSGYRGEVKVYLHNTGKEPYLIATGDRIAQFLFVDVHHVVFEEADELSESVRLDGGFGSSGKK